MLLLLLFLQFIIIISILDGCQPLSVNNGNVRYAGSNGIQKFSFNCQNGFAPMGKTFSTCLSGQWSNPNPFCVGENLIIIFNRIFSTEIY